MEQKMSNCSLKDCGLFGVDCVVVCCCCPCLLLQVTVYVFIRLPRRVAVKSKRFVLKKLRKRSKKDNGEIMIKKDMRGSGLDGGSWWLQADTDISWRRRSPLFVMHAERMEEEEIFMFLKKEKGIENCRSFLNMEEEVEPLDNRTRDVEGNVWEQLVVEEGLLWFGSFWGVPG